jgi:hypothetical protein
MKRQIAAKPLPSAPPKLPLWDLDLDFFLATLLIVNDGEILSA